MKKNIWIFNHYGCTPCTGRLLRHYYFGKNLIQRNREVTVFVSNQLHYLGKTFDTEGKLYKEKSNEGVPFVFINTPKYFDNGLKRIINMVSYMIKLFIVTKKYAESHKSKPDVIIASSPQPLTCISGIFIARRYKVPCIIEIRDLWPESLIEYGKLKKGGILAGLLYKGEKWIYEKADKIIFTFEGGKDYIKERGWEHEIPLEKIADINNGINFQEFNEQKNIFSITDGDLDDEKTFKVVYCGSVRQVNNVRAIIDVAEELQKREDGKEIRFLIWGSGTEEEELKGLVNEKNLANIVFKGQIEKKYIPYILSKSNLNLMHGRLTGLLRFGCSPNKLFDYFAAGKPILSDIPSNYDLIKKYNCGIVIDNGTVQNLADAIVKVVRLDEKSYGEMCRNAKRAAGDYDFKKLTDKLIKVIESGECKSS